MKIKLLKDLPWVGKGNILETNTGLITFGSSGLSIVDLAAGGFIEEIKDDIAYITTPQLRTLWVKHEGGNRESLENLQALRRIRTNDKAYFEGLDKDGNIIFGEISLDRVMGWWQIGLIAEPNGRFAGGPVPTQEKEKVSDDIEILRKFYLPRDSSNIGELNDEEIKWFTAYRIVKACIEKLNGDWKPDWTNDEEKYSIWYDCSMDVLDYDMDTFAKVNFLPVCKEKTARKVVSLCEPELRVLFGIKS